MVGTINPAVSGARLDWVVGIAGYFAGSMVGSLTTLFLAAFAGSLLVKQGGLVARLVMIGFVAFALLREAGVRVPLPYAERQVPESWRRTMPGSRYAFSYGAMLGLGFATLFVTSAHLSMILGVAASGSPRLAILAALAFAIGKTLVLLTAAGVKNLSELASRQPVWERGSYRRIIARKSAGMLPSGVFAIYLLTNVSGRLR